MLCRLIVLIAITGAILNIFKKRQCFLFWIVSNGFWAQHNFRIGEYEQVVVFVVFIIVSIWGWFNWRVSNGKDNRNCT